MMWRMNHQPLNIKDSKNSMVVDMVDTMKVEKITKESTTEENMDSTTEHSMDLVDTTMQDTRELLAFAGPFSRFCHLLFLPATSSSPGVSIRSRLSWRRSLARRTTSGAGNVVVRRTGNAVVRRTGNVVLPSNQLLPSSPLNQLLSSIRQLSRPRSPPSLPSRKFPRIRKKA